MPGVFEMLLLPRQFMVLPLLLLVPRIWALQVSPNSPCAAICLDDGTKDASDPKTSNTYGSDIVCSDTSYTKTVTGEKFEACISCLQTSSFSESDENDQAWFICESTVHEAEDKPLTVLFAR